MDTASLAPARFLTQIVEEAIELARHAALTAAVAAESETSEIIRRRLFEWDENAVTADGRVLLTREAHSAAAGEPRIDVKATMSASSVTDSPVEEEGFSANLPKAEDFCGFLILFLGRVYPTRVSLATGKTRPFLNLSASLGAMRRSCSPCWTGPDHRHFAVSGRGFGGLPITALSSYSCWRGNCHQGSNNK